MLKSLWLVTLFSTLLAPVLAEASFAGSPTAANKSLGAVGNVQQSPLRDNRPDLVCYMQTSDNRVLNLGALCGTAAKQRSIPSVTAVESVEVAAPQAAAPVAPPTAASQESPVNGVAMENLSNTGEMWDVNSPAASVPDVVINNSY